MSFDAFLKLDNVEGESTDAKFKGQIELKNFDTEVTNSTSNPSSNGNLAGASRAKFPGINLTKLIDKSSPKLFEGAASGAQYKQAVITVCRAGGAKIPFLILTLSNVRIARFKLQGKTADAANSSNGESPDKLPEENFTLTFGKMIYQYVKTDVNGGQAGGNTVGGWDLTENKVAAA